MPFVFIFLLLVLASAVALGWLTVCLVLVGIRLVFRALVLPFRLVRRIDNAVAARRQRYLPARPHRADDVQCTNAICRARLPVEARFCARCGCALPPRRMPAPALLVDVRRRPYSQVA